MFFPQNFNLRIYTKVLLFESFQGNFSICWLGRFYYCCCGVVLFSQMLHGLSQSTNWRDLIERFKCFHMRVLVTDSGLELRGRGEGGGFVLLALSAFHPSEISFLPKIKGGAPGPLP